MFNRDSITGIAKLRAWGAIKAALFILIGALIAAPLSGANAKPSANPDVASNVTAPTSPTNSIRCVPIEVAVIKNQVHVRCATPVDGISYFTTATSEAGHAARILSTLTTALLASKQIEIAYDPADLSGTALGCTNDNCRMIIWVVLFA